MKQPIFDPETGEVVEEAPGGAPPLPPALGLEEAAALLARAHGVAVGKDDPLLMVVTLQQAFLGDLEKRLFAHDERINAILGATGNVLGDAVEHVLDGLKDQAIRANLEHAFGLVDQQARAMEDLKRSLRRHRWLVLGSNFFAGLCLALAITILFTVLQ